MILASTAIDTIKPNREPAVKTCLSYIPTDSALFLTHAEDRILLKKQKQHYEPLIRWTRQELNLNLKTTDRMIGKLDISQDSAKVAIRIIENLVCSQR